MKTSILYLLTVSLICSMPVVAGAQNKVDYCEPTTVVKEELKKLLMKDDEDLTERQKFERRMSMLPKLLQQYPEDFFIRKAYLDYRNNNYFAAEKLREEYRLLFEQRPKDPIAVYLYSRLLVGYKTKEAIEILNKAVAESPGFPWSHIQLVHVYNTPVFRDQAKAKENLKKWFSICPNQRERLWLVSTIGDTELMAETAKRLRARLESSVEGDLTLWSDLWSWEFKLKPVPEHAQVRAKIAQDLKTLRAKDLGAKDRLIVLRSGYKMLNDKEGKQWVEGEMARRYPKSRTLLSWLQEHWQEANPWPAPDAPDEKKQAFYQARLKALNEWLKQWPNERDLWDHKFFAAAEIAGFPNAELEAIGERVLKLSEAEDFFSIPPIQTRVAQAYSEHNMATERIPSLILKGFEEMERFGKRNPPSDLYKREDEIEDVNLRYVRWKSWPLLVEAYAKLKQPDKAREVLQQLADSLKKLKPADNPKAGEKSEYAGHQFLYWQAVGKLADIENRKLDALASYQTALSFRANTPKIKDELKEDIDRLWKELGGTEEGRNALLSRNDVKKAAEATGESWDTANKPLPDFALTDLQGKKWQLADLKAKTVFINFWATWCGPCRQELPYIEKLHEQMKDKKDVLILTFNIDDELGLVEPFMKENKYTFTVILGPDYASSQEVYGIPHNWIVGPGGAIKFDGLGFGGDGEAFLKKAIAAIEKARENK